MSRQVSDRTTTQVMRSLALPLYLPRFLIEVSQGILLPTLPVFAGSFTDSLTLVALVIATAPLGNLICDIPAGVLISRFSGKGMMLVGCAVLALCSFSLGIADDLGQLILIRFITGLGLALTFISGITLVADTVRDKDRGRVTAVFGGSMRIGMFVGPILVGLLVSSIGLRGSIHLSGLVALAAIPVVFIFPGPASRRSDRNERQPLSQTIGSLRMFNKAPITFAAIGSLFLMLIRSARFTLVPVYGAFALNLDVETIGLITGLAGGIDMTLFPLSGYLMDRFGRKYAAIPSLLVLSLGMVLVAISNSAVMLIVAAIVLGLGNGLGSGAMMTLGTDLAPRDGRSQFLGAWRVIGGTGALAGPIMVGGMADLVGFMSCGLILSGVGVISAAFYFKKVPETLQRGI